MIRIRRFLPDDEPAVWALHYAALRAAGADVLGDGSWDDDLRDIPGSYLNGSGDFLVGIIDGEIVAMGALRRAHGGAEIKRMRVDPAFQRRGFGRHILRLLQERAIELGYRRLQLDVGPNLTAALSLYAAEGFVEVGRGEIGGSPAIFLAKNLW